MPSVDPIIERYLPEIIAFRHDLHRNPEMGYQEVETSRKVVERLEATGRFDIQKGIAKTGIVATLGTDKPGPGIALRADMDCLPITETSGKEWASENPGFMHACGHDGHTSCLLGTALVLSEVAESLKGPVKFIFQPAEEGGGGGEQMVEAGVLEKPAVDMVFGLHGWPSRSIGEITTCRGPMMANADEFEILIHGRGGHAAFPARCIDPIVAASQVVTALQPLTTIDASPTDSVVVTIGKIAGGTAFNIIPDTVRLLGTIRTMSEESQKQVFEEIRSISSRIAEQAGASADTTITRGYPVLVNHPEAVSYLEGTLLTEESGVKLVHEEFPQPVGEDFAYLAQVRPACFFGLGLRPKDADSFPQLHQADFDFNDDALPIGMRCFAELVLKFWD